MVNYLIYITKVQLQLSTNKHPVIETLKQEAELASSLYCWDFYPNPEGHQEIRNDPYNLIFLNKGAIVIRAGVHVTIIGFKRRTVEDIASRLDIDPKKLNIKCVRMNPQDTTT